MSTELNSGTVGGFGHMGPNDPYNDGHSGSGSSGGSFNGGGNGGHDNSSGSSYTASFGLSHQLTRLRNGCVWRQIPASIGETVRGYVDDAENDERFIHGGFYNNNNRA